MINAGGLPADPVHGDAVRTSDVSQVQVHFFHWVVAVIVECGDVGAFDGAKLRSPAENRPVHHTYRHTTGPGRTFMYSPQ